MELPRFDRKSAAARKVCNCINDRIDMRTSKFKRDFSDPMRRALRRITCIGLVLGMTTAWALVPGGLVASYQFGSGSASSVEVTMTIESPPPDNSSYFWAQQFFTSTTIDHGGYFGIQTGGVIGGQNVGKMLIFSIWNADQAEAGPGATAQSFGGEGIGYSVRMPMQWLAGAPYRFRLEKDGALWWRLSVSAPHLPSTLIGRIRITQDVPLQSRFVSFTEYFRNLNSCADLPAVRVSVGDMLYGNAPVPVSSAAAYGNCITMARGYLRGNVAVHDVGFLYSDGFE